MQFSNPFDDAQGHFYILQNSQGQYSLWPQQCELPEGWQPICDPQPAPACTAWLAERWQTLTPAHAAGVAHE